MVVVLDWNTLQSCLRCSFCYCCSCVVIPEYALTISFVMVGSELHVNSYEKKKQKPQSHQPTQNRSDMHMYHAIDRTSKFANTVMLLCVCCCVMKLSVVAVAVCVCVLSHVCVAVHCW